MSLIPDLLPAFANPLPVAKRLWYSMACWFHSSYGPSTFLLVVICGGPARSKTRLFFLLTNSGPVGVSICTLPSKTARLADVPARKSRRFVEGANDVC